MMVGYTAVVLSALSRTPLWLDELLQALGTRNRTFQKVTEWALLNRGGVPLPYYLQKLFFDLLSYSTFVARLPAALFSIGCGVLFIILSRKLDIAAPTVPLALFLLAPAQFRYALEARGYSEGLFFSLLIVLSALSAESNPGPRQLAVFITTLALGLYSQPYVAFVVVGIVLFLAANCVPSNDSIARRAARRILTAAFVSGLCFLPWIFAQHQAQTNRVDPVPQAGFSVQQLKPLGIIHGISGGGYVCSIVLISLALVAVCRRFHRCRSIRLLSFICASTLIGPLVGDAAFNYFYSDRQLLFALPSLALLAGAGSRFLGSIKPLLLLLICALYLVVAGFKDYKQATTPKEDWQGVSTDSWRLLLSGGCVVSAPPEHLDLFAFFQPSLLSSACANDHSKTRVIVLLDPYTTEDERKLVVNRWVPEHKIVNQRHAGRFSILTLVSAGLNSGYPQK